MVESIHEVRLWHIVNIIWIMFKVMSNFVIKPMSMNLIEIRIFPKRSYLLFQAYWLLFCKPWQIEFCVLYDMKLPSLISAPYLIYRQQMFSGSA